MDLKWKPDLAWIKFPRKVATIAGIDICVDPKMPEGQIDLVTDTQRVSIINLAADKQP